MNKPLLALCLLLPLSVAAWNQPQTPAAFAPYAIEPVDLHPEWDAGYTRLIRESTTGPQFMTDLVDHLTSSERVPSPLKFNGYIAGAPQKHPHA